MEHRIALCPRRSAAPGLGVLMAATVAAYGSLASAQQQQQTPRTPAPQQAPAGAQQGPAAAPQTLSSLATQRVTVASAALAAVQTEYRAGAATVADVAAWMARVYAARRDAGATGPALIAAAQEWADGMRTLERLVQSRVGSGSATHSQALQATWFRLEAETELARVSGHH